jgi:26S proteasome regulatory subunit N3
MTTHETTFRADDTYTLISRLRQNVIKTGLRTMSLTYSRISLRDVCLKLGLDSEETTEYIVAKAIRDGVIEATINHEGGYMQNKEVLDVYATEEPMLAFDERIRFCMSLHNEAIKVHNPPIPLFVFSGNRMLERKLCLTFLLSCIVLSSFGVDVYVRL